MRQVGWLWALRPVPVLAALGVVLGGCACCGPRHYGDADRAVGYRPMGVQPGPTHQRDLERSLATGGRSR